MHFRLPMRTILAASLALLLAGPVLGEGVVYDQPESVKPLVPGSAVPAARLQTVAGEPLALPDLVRDEGALLVFYRGGW